MVEVNNLTTVKIDENFFKKITEEILKKENKKEASLSIALVGPGRIKQLNKKYRHKNRVTDVLSFEEPKIFSSILKKELNLGEIVICLREVKKNAKRFNSTFEEELMRVLIHGILHLLGYDHEISPEKEKEMQEKQDYYLSLIKNLN